MQKHSQDNLRQAIRLAYVAGLIDGEGTIRIAKAKSENNTWNYTYKAALSFVNTNRRMSEIVSEFMGTRIYDSEYGSSGKTMYRVQKMGLEGVAELLKKILPYLEGKKKQAELVIEFCDKKTSYSVKDSPKTGKKGGNYIPKEEIELREKYYWKVKNLNEYRSRND